MKLYLKLGCQKVLALEASRPPPDGDKKLIYLPPPQFAQLNLNIILLNTELKKLLTRNYSYN